MSNDSSGKEFESVTLLTATGLGEELKAEEQGDQRHTAEFRIKKGQVSGLPCPCTFTIAFIYLL